MLTEWQGKTLCKEKTNLVIKLTLLLAIIIGSISISVSLRANGPTLLTQIKEFPKNTVWFCSELKNQMYKIYVFINHQFFGLGLIGMKHKPLLVTKNFKYLKARHPVKKLDFRQLLNQIPQRIVKVEKKGINGIDGFKYKMDMNLDFNHTLI